MFYKFCFGLGITALSFLLFCKSPSEVDQNDMNGNKILSLQNPVNGTSLETPDLTFTWNKINGATGYHIAIDEGKTFLSPELTQKTPDNSYTPTKEFSLGTYYWRVRARDADGVWGDWTPVWSFTLIQTLIPPPAPVLIAPKDESDTKNKTPLFSWNTVNDAVNYELIVDDDADFNSPIIHDSTIPKAEYTPASSMPLGTYYWRVRALNSKQISDWSSTKTFTVREPYEYELLIIGMWKATYVQGYYSIYSEFMFAKSGTISNYKVYESHMHGNHTTLYVGSFEIMKYNNDYYLFCLYKNWDLPPDASIHKNELIPIKFNSEKQLQILLQSADYGDFWVTYSRL